MPANPAIPDYDGVYTDPCVIADAYLIAVGCYALMHNGDINVPIRVIMVCIKHIPSKENILPNHDPVCSRDGTPSPDVRSFADKRFLHKVMEAFQSKPYANWQQS